MSDNSDLQKIKAAAAALDYVQDGMVLGLGTGSTAAHFVRLLGDKVKKGCKIQGVPTSIATQELALSLQIPLLDIEKVTHIDVTIDGADEVDPQLRLIKGGGAALLREKLIAHASAHMVVIADEGKMVDILGKFPLPVEIIQFGVAITANKIFECLRATNCEGTDIQLRYKSDGTTPLVTDNGNFILDCHCIMIPDPIGLCAQLNAIPGVVENGIFPIFANTNRTLVLGTSEGAKVVELVS
ncbi:MAG: ribose 5-phosphate isomerase A [Hyphomonadaceae bacterium]|nr:MAG: ribose 5-phosphate isomerase A [Hyphomonadaceae bacterium]